MKKNAVLLIVVILLFITIPLGLIGCETEYQKNIKRIFETDFFRCINYNGEDTVQIIELTKRGAEQEYIIIPQEINGMKVVLISDWIKGMSNYQSKSGRKSEKIKKLFIKDNLILSGDIYSFSSNPIDVIFLNNEVTKATMWSFSHINNFYFNNIEIAKRYFDDEKYVKKYNNCNIRFYLNNQLIWLDCYNEKGVYALPDNVDEKTEWYTDKEYQKKWNKEYPVDDNTELNLYAKWTGASGLPGANGSSVS